MGWIKPNPRMQRPHSPYGTYVKKGPIENKIVTKASDFWNITRQIPIVSCCYPSTATRAPIISLNNTCQAKGLARSAYPQSFETIDAGKKGMEWLITYRFDIQLLTTVSLMSCYHLHIPKYIPFFSMPGTKEHFWYQQWDAVLDIGSDVLNSLDCIRAGRTPGRDVANF